MTNTANNAPRERLIFALDVGGGLEEALSWVDRLWDHVGLFKVGKESFVRYGTEIVRQIHARGGKVFLDLKFHDIPHTVARAAEAAFELGVAMFNVHALGGRRDDDRDGQRGAAVGREAGQTPADCSGGHRAYQLE